MPDTIPIITRRASFAPQSVNLDARTVDVTWSTGAPVKRRDVEGSYIERLSLDAKAVDLSRLIGASVLDAHRQTAVRDVLGTVRNATVTGKEGIATIQFSARPEVEPIWQDVTAGILRHISVGYSVEQWADSIETGTRVLTATRWTPHEISLVPSPADPGATVRMEDTNMEHQTAAPDNNPAQSTTTIAETAPDTVQTRATINTEIRSIANVAGLDQSFVDGLTGAVISDTTLSAARLALRTQKGLSGQPVRATPKYLMVPPALETVAEKWLATVAAAKAADVNPFSGSLSLVVEPRLASATRWYITADPSEIDGLEFAYLAGGEGPQVESKSGWDVDGVEIRVILDFGAGFIDHRGWFANAGA